MSKFGRKNNSQSSTIPLPPESEEKLNIVEENDLNLFELREDISEASIMNVKEHPNSSEGTLSETKTSPI